MGRVMDYSFKAFSDQPFFRQVNTWLVEHAGLEPGAQVVDVACGSGMVTELILERVRGAREALVVALDMSASALRDAKQRLVGASDAALEFVQAQAEEMSRSLRRTMDAVIFCNGIHYIEDKQRLLREVRCTLRAGGTFAFNTSFFDGAHPADTQAFYRRWMLKALRILKTRYGLSPDRKKVAARRQLTQAEYHQALEAAGFRIRIEEVVPATLDERSWIAISQFSDFVEGVLPGVPLEQASEALCEGLQETFAELGLTGVQRNWLSVVATTD